MELRWYQREASYSVYDYFVNQGKGGNPVIALPTGTGKSLVIADILKNIFEGWPNQRAIMLTHVKELIEQNANEIYRYWPTAPLGIYSAGLAQRDIAMPIIFGGIASVKNCIERFGHRDLVFIDEAHLLSPKDDTMYQFVLAALKLINPHLKVIGLTATPYRLRQGMLTDNGIFTDVCYDATSTDMYNRLIAEGYICPLIPKRTEAVVDVSEVGINNGDYAKGKLESEVEKITYKACKEIVEQGADRASWLTFASGIANAEHIASFLQSFGVQAAAVHSELDSKENDRRIRDFKNGSLRCLVNMGKLTTGFNHPPVDLIAMLRPTISPGLHVQMWGRGTRPSPSTGKQNCLGLDFARNVARLGPINDPKIPGRPGKGTGDVPIKICDCGAYNHISARHCCACGAPFEFETKIFAQAASDEIIRSDAPIVEIFNVKKIIYNRHEKKNREGILLSPPSLKVSYFCGMRMFNEWICFESRGLPLHKAHQWWMQRSANPFPVTTHEALQRINELKEPRAIRVWVNKQFPEILGYEY